MAMSGVTLLLNASYEPLSVISWQRAVTLLFSDKVEVLSVYDDREIRSVSFSIQMPSVVRLLRYARRRLLGIKLSRQNVFIRDGYACQYCGRTPPEVELSIDHVLPRSRGGRTSWENITTCCMACNREKGSRTPMEAGMALLRLPYRPTFSLLLVFHSHLKHPPADWSLYL